VRAVRDRAMTGPLLASRVMKARRQSTCPICRGPIRVGELIAKTVKWAHAGCVIASRYYGQGQDSAERTTIMRVLAPLCAGLVLQVECPELQRCGPPGR
jgi:hypothetical protein